MKRPVAQITSLQLTTNAQLQSMVCDFKWFMLLLGEDHWGLAPAQRQAEHATAWQRGARRPPNRVASSLYRSLEWVNSRARIV